MYTCARFECVLRKLANLGISPDMIESVVSGMLWITVVTIVTAILTAIVAKRKGRSVAGWTIFALSIPVVPLLVVWLLPRRLPHGD